jgi:DNA-binding transcriptional regulator YiaG
MQRKASGIRPEKVKAARTASGLTQAEAAQLVYTSIDNWQNWEQGRNIMARAIYELFLLRWPRRAQICGEHHDQNEVGWLTH